MTENSKIRRWALQPALIIALVALLVCGIIYPLVVTGIAQVLFPYQSNGEIIQVNGEDVGSNLIAQNFTLPVFFHPRTDSASGVDPDITLQDAYSQVSRIQNATGISEAELTQLIDKNHQGAYLVLTEPYVNVLHLNLALIEQYPSVYSDFR